jgi:hypothetical protein
MMGSMASDSLAKSAQRIAIIAGGGRLPVAVANSVAQAGHTLLVIDLAGEADLNDISPLAECDAVEWGQVGRLFSRLEAFNTDQVVIVGSISRRPELREVKLDWGGVQMLPRLMATLLAGGDTTVLDNVARIFADKGFTLVGAHEVAPGLTARHGHVAGPKLSEALRADVMGAAQGAWAAGHMDMGQGAVCVAARLVAMEGAEGTDGMLERVATMRQARRFSSKGKTGALAKCARPEQDLRMDMPVIGPRTVENAAKAGLSAIVIEAGHVMISQQQETIALCKANGVALLSEPRETFVPVGRTDTLA